MKKILLMLVILLSTISTQARKFYFSASGSDSYTTTQAQNPNTPWKTLSKAQSNVANGDSVLFAKGSKFTGTLTLNSKSNIYFGVYGSGADPLFWGTGATRSVLFTLNTCTNITFYGWNISDTTISFTDRYVQAKIQNVFATYQGCSGIVIRKCRMDRIGYGAYFPPGNNNNTVDSCDIGNLRMIKNTPTSVNADDDYGGVPVQLSSKNNTVTNNYFHDCYAVSYDYGYDGGGVEFFEEGDTIKGNVIMYNTFYDCNGAFEFGSSNNSFADNPQVDNVIAYNKIINSSSLIYINNNGQYRTKVTNLQCYNNVILQTVASRTGDMNMISMATSDATTGIVVIKNNIFQLSTGTDVTRSSQWNNGQLTHTNNIYKLSNNSITNFTLDSTESGLTGNTWVDTTNVNPLYWNYNLLPSSSFAIDNGANVGLTRDFDGNVVSGTPSIGVYQYTTTSNSNLQATSTYSTVLCNGGNSTVTVTASGGTPPYTGVGTFTRTAGAYGYTVTDATQATSRTTGSIPQPSAVSGTVNWINGLSTTITASITASGGTSPYTYSIIDSKEATKPGTGLKILNQGSSTFTGVPYGSGTITIKDANSCQYTTSYTINNVGLPTGRTFYISNSGSDSYTTTQAQNPSTPWATLSKVQSSLSTFTSGDRILFAKGSRFSGSLTLTSKTGLYFGVYGTGADPLFWGTGATRSVLFTLNACTNITFYGWNISDTTISATDRTVQAKIQNVFVSYQGSTGIVIRKCTMDRIGYGAYFPDGCNGNTMDSCDIGNLRMIRNTPTSVNADDDYGGVPIQLSSRNNTVTNNYFHDCYAVSYDYGYDGGGVEFFEEGDTIKGNVIMYNTFYDCNGTFEFGSNNDNVANNPQIDNIIAYNKIINSSSLTYINNNGQYRTYVRNLQIYNNIIVQNVASRTGGSRMISRALGDTATGIIILKNNIFQINYGYAASVARSGQWTGAELVHTNNIYKLSGSTVTNFTLDSTERGSTGNTWTDTSNVNPLYWNYNLLPSSSFAIGNGANVGLTRDFDGNVVSDTPSIGVYQYTTTSNSNLQATSTYSTVLCNGGNSTVTVTASGGTPPYTGVGTFTRTAGSYGYTVTDATQATSRTTGSIPQPSAVSGTVSWINGLSTTITASITASGGTSPYTYSINATGLNILNQGSSTFTGVPYGSGTITIKDANSCQYTTSYTIVNNVVIPTGGRTFYISNSGSDSYTVTQAQNPSTPWATLSKVQSSLSTFTSGDRILFAKGSKFSGTLTIQSKTGLYFGAYGTGANPLFWGTGSTIGSLVTTRNCTNVTFYGWNISDTTISFSNRFIQAKIQIVFTFESSSTGMVVRKCTMDRIGYGLYITKTSPGNTMDSCDIGNLRMIRNTQGGNDDYGGVPVQISSSNNTITNNYFHDCYAESYDYNLDGGGVEFFEEGVVIENNVIAYNTFINGNGTFEFGSNADGVANNLIRNNKIYYNKFINNNTIVYINNNSEYTTKVTNLQFYNNVMLQTDSNTNPSGSSGIQFSMMTDDTTSGIIVLKNNIFQVTNGLPIKRNNQLTGSNFIHTNNIYKLSGGSITNFTLDATERGSTGNTWTDTSNVNPLYWNYNLLPSSSFAIGNGANVGLTRDFGGNIVGSTPSIGIYNSAASTPCSFTYGAWTTCSGGTQTRTYTSTPAGCTGTPDADSLTKSCEEVPCSFTYGAWTNCIDGTQTRTYTSTPAGCTGTPDSSLSRSCVTPTCSFTYSAWSTCTNGTQTRTYSSTPTGCVGSPDILSRSCTVPVVISKFSYSSKDKRISITCNVSGTMIIKRGNSIVRTVNYAARAATVSVSGLPAGTYTASTYGSTITFKR